MTLRYVVCALLAGVVLAGAADAQADCPVLERAALAQAELWCTDVDAGQVCYGSPRVRVSTPPEAPDVDFTALGESVPLTGIRSLWSQTGEARWGVAVLRPQAYPVGSWQAGVATLVLLGDATIINTGQEFSSIQTQAVTISAPRGVNIRSGPNTNYRVIAAAREGERIKATGQLAGGSWLRVQLPTGVNGWMTAAATDDTRARLPQVSSEDDPPGLLYPPFSAFQLISAPAARCEAAPDSGVLLQTPAGAEPLRFVVNGVAVLLRGTAFIQAQSDLGLRINVLTGQATATVRDEVLQIAEGFRLVQALIVDDAGPRPAESAPRVQPYAYARMITLPLDLLPLPAYYGLDLASIIRPRPESGSPLAGMLISEPCRVTVGEGGVNLRTGPGTDYPIRGVIDFRESAEPIGRTVGTDGFNWWQLALDVWLRTDTTVIGGDCAAVPDVPAPPPPPRPTATPPPDS